MKPIRHLPPLLLLVALACLAPPPAAAEPTLTEAERQSAVEALESSLTELQALVADVGEADWGRKPASDKWSVGEVAEHLLLSERLLWQFIQEALEGEPNPDWREATAGKMDRIREFMPNRGIKAQAPGPLHPTGEVGRAACLEELAAARARTIELARTTQLPVKRYTAMHPADFFGEMNVYQWLEFIAAHTARHNQQIAEVKAMLAEAKAAA